MEPRRLQLRAPRPGDRRPAAGLLALLLWLALQGAATMPAGPGGPEDPEQPQDAGLPRGILQQAARAALHFFNFRAGSPSALRVLAAVQNGRARVSGAAACTGKRTGERPATTPALACTLAGRRGSVIGRGKWGGCPGRGGP